MIHAKFEAGLLRPYNHVAGYTRLMKWMADKLSRLLPPSFSVSLLILAFHVTACRRVLDNELSIL